MAQPRILVILFRNFDSKNDRCFGCIPTHDSSVFASFKHQVPVVLLQDEQLPVLSAAGSDLERRSPVQHLHPLLPAAIS